MNTNKLQLKADCPMPLEEEPAVDNRLEIMAANEAILIQDSDNLLIKELG